MQHRPPRKYNPHRAALKPLNQEFYKLLQALAGSHDLVIPAGMPTHFLLTDAALEALQKVAGEYPIASLEFTPKLRKTATAGINDADRYTTLITEKSLQKPLGDGRATANLKILIETLRGIEKS